MRSVVLRLPKLLGIAACDELDQTVRARVQTVLALFDDPQRIEDTSGRCRNDPGDVGQSIGCRNANHTVERMMIVGRDHTVVDLMAQHGDRHDNPSVR